MLFNSEVFLFLFLPVTLLLYYFVFLSHPMGKNIFLLAMSLLFYAYGEPVYVLLMIFMIAMHYVFAIGIDRNRKNKQIRNLLLLLCIVADILIFGYFKYTNFMIHNINGLLGTNIADKNIRLPIGISFYTFQAISYVVDVYRKKLRYSVIHYILVCTSLFSHSWLLDRLYVMKQLNMKLKTEERIFEILV